MPLLPRPLPLWDGGDAAGPAGGVRLAAHLRRGALLGLPLAAAGLVTQSARAHSQYLSYQVHKSDHPRCLGCRILTASYDCPPRAVLAAGSSA